MVEYIREIKIAVIVDTNKSTYEKEFDDIYKANSWLSKFIEGL